MLRVQLVPRIYNNPGAPESANPDSQLAIAPEMPGLTYAYLLRDDDGRVALHRRIEVSHRRCGDGSEVRHSERVVPGRRRLLRRGRRTAIALTLLCSLLILITIPSDLKGDCERVRLADGIGAHAAAHRRVVRHACAQIETLSAPAPKPEICNAEQYCEPLNKSADRAPPLHCRMDSPRREVTSMSEDFPSVDVALQVSSRGEEKTARY